MTGITDERGGRWASYEYDETGRVKASKLAGGAAKYQFNRFGQSRPARHFAQIPLQMFNKLIAQPPATSAQSNTGSRVTNSAA